MTPPPQTQTCWIGIPNTNGRYLRLQFVTETIPEDSGLALGQETTTAAELITTLQAITFRNLKFTNPH